MTSSKNTQPSAFQSISSLALIFGDEHERGPLRTALDSQGFTSAAFDSVQALWDSISLGRRYDALVACADKAWNQRRWASLRGVVKLPVLVVISRDAMNVASTFNDEPLNSERVEFVTAPVNGAELSMRLQLLQSRKLAPVDLPAEEDLVCGGYYFKRLRRIVMVDGEEVRLQPREFDIALILFENLGKVITREEIETRLFDRLANPGSRVLDVHITRLRKKLELGPHRGVQLLTIYGIGYRLVVLGSTFTS